jgi:hypothetical protein
MNNEKAGRTKPTLDQAQLALDRLDEEISGKVVRILFRKRLKDRLKDKEAKKPPPTMTFYRGSLDKFVQYLGGRAYEPIGKTTKQGILAFRNCLRNQVRAKTVNRQIQTALIPWKVLAGSAAFAFAAPAYLQPRAFCEEIPRPAEVRFDEMQQILTGEKSRSWVYERTDVKQGTSDECKQGDIYRFATNHFVVWEHCESGHIKEDQQRWTLTQEGHDAILTINDKRYTVLFKQAPTGWLMKLRTPSDSKTVPTIDKEYYYKEE